MSVNTVKQDGSLQRIAGGTLYADAPIGAIMPYGGATAPSGWLLCQGQAISRTNYSDLFNAIGTAFGTGDGSTTFNIPDLRGEFLRGAGTNSHTNQGGGGIVGEHQDGTILDGNGTVDNQMRINKHTSSLFDKVHSSNSPVAYVTGATAQSSNGVYGTVRPTNTSVNYIIKAKQVAAPADFKDAIDDALNEFAKSISLVSVNNSSIAYDKSRIIGGIVTVCASITVPSGNHLVKENAVAYVPSLGTASIGYILPCLYRNIGNGAEEPGYVIIQTDGNLYPYYTKTEYNEIRINTSYSSKV